MRIGLHRASLLMVSVLGITLAVGDEIKIKDHSRMITAEMRRNAVENAKKHDWARVKQKWLIEMAARYLEISDHDLWIMVTPQSLPRTTLVMNIEGTDLDSNCPQCEKRNVQWQCEWEEKDSRKNGKHASVENELFSIIEEKDPLKSWKIKCPNCDEIYPKNDFWAYYLSALDEHGIFQPGKGNPKLLFNTRHPDPKDPLHKFGVDDGYGWRNPKDGLRYDFVAFYNQSQWRFIRNALSYLGSAYTITDDPRYAHKAGVLLDRIADVYPDMDMEPYIRKMGYVHSDGCSMKGGIEGCIWETDVAVSFSTAYDRVFDGIAKDKELVRFLNGMAKKYKLGDKSSFAAIQKNIEDNLIIEFIKGLKDGRIRGNHGMHQRAALYAAIALDRQPLSNETIDLLFDPKFHGGKIPYLINHRIDRDGMGDEGAPGYASWAGNFLSMALQLESFDDYKKNDILRDFPKLKQYCLSTAAMQCLGQAVPSIGDMGSCGYWYRWNPNFSAFQAYKHPLLARRLLPRVGKTRQSIYEKEGNNLAGEIREMAEKAPKNEPAGVNLNGFGLAILQTPKPANEAAKGRSMWIYYGRNTGHGHRDRLNLGLYAENIDMLPDMGYPEYAAGRPQDEVWTRNTITHNVVLGGDGRQHGSYTGHLLLMDPEGKARVFYVESDGIFKDMTTYRRLSVLVDVSDTSGYAADFFWVRGGNDFHLQSWHGPPGKTTTTGLKLVKQAKGTYKGENVPFGRNPKSPGFMFLYNVRRDGNPSDQFSVDYNAIDLRGRIKKGKDPHLRLTCLTPASEVALAHGDPPQNKSGNPRNLTYTLIKREAQGKDHESLFVTLIEPYDTHPIIKSTRRLKVKVSEKGVLAAAVEVQLVSGRTDTIIAAERPMRMETGTGVVLNGTFGILARRGKEIEFAKLAQGTSLSSGKFSIKNPIAEIKGKVLECNIKDPANNYVIAKLDSKPSASLKGRLVIFENDRERDAAYDIVSIEKAKSGHKISLGEKTLIRGYKDPKDYASGYILDVNPNDTLRIPLTVYVEGKP